MSNNAQLPVEVMKQINDEADKYGFVVPYDGSNKFYDDGRVNGYIAGATEWAQWKVKYDELKTQFDNLQTVYADLFNTAQNSANKHQQLKERCEKMEATLKELCYLKKLKEEEGRTNEYMDKQPLAWENAFALTRDGTRECERHSRYSKDQITSAIWEELREADHTGENNGRAYEIIGVVTAALERIKGGPQRCKMWVKDALQWSKEAIEFANKELECPEHLVETWGNLYMNVMNAIQEAQCEIDETGEVAKASQDAFLPGQSEVAENISAIADRISDNLMAIVKKNLGEGNKQQEWDSERMIGRVKDRFKELEEKQHDWRSFYNGWLEGRVDMLSQTKGWGQYKPEEGEKEVKP